MSRLLKIYFGLGMQETGMMGTIGQPPAVAVLPDAVLRRLMMFFLMQIHFRLRGKA